MLLHLQNTASDLRKVSMWIFIYFFSSSDVFLYALSHDDSPSLLISVVLLLLLGSCQERRWGSVTFLLLSIITITTLAFIYTLVLFVVGGEASRICGFSAIQLALFTAQCRQATQRRLLRCLPVWFLPWLFLLSGLLLLPGTPAFSLSLYVCFFSHLLSLMIPLCHFFKILFLVEAILYFGQSAYLYDVLGLTSVCLAFLCLCEGSGPKTLYPPSPAWVMEVQAAAAVSEAEVLEEQLLRAGIMASLQDAPDTKVEVPKSSVSSLRLQQLEKMGFPTEKAVVALAATKQLDGAISLLIEDSIGEQAVVVSKGKSHPPQQSP
uniref:Peptidase S54 rhomboid domain-containing protein n=1 Tax=Poecilia mexicana TaxID=48701 RepID=A0A3B3Z2S5_9TELE